MSGEHSKRRQVSTTPKTLGASGNNRRKVEPHCSNPPIIRRRALVGIVAGVDHPAWLDQHQLHLLGSERLVGGGPDDTSAGKPDGCNATRYVIAVCRGYLAEDYDSSHYYSYSVS